MKIDTEILRTREGKFVWADDNPSGYGFLEHPVGRDVPDSWLEANGLIDPESEPEPEPEKPEPKQEPKKAAQPRNKAVKAPPNDK